MTKIFQEQALTGTTEFTNTNCLFGNKFLILLFNRSSRRLGDRYTESKLVGVPRKLLV